MYLTTINTVEKRDNTALNPNNESVIHMASPDITPIDSGILAFLPCARDCPTT